MYILVIIIAVAICNPLYTRYSKKFVSIGAFNALNLGVKKLTSEYSDAVLMELYHLVQKYDILFLQEVFVNGGNTQDILLDFLGSKSRLELQKQLKDIYKKPLPLGRKFYSFRDNIPFKLDTVEPMNLGVCVSKKLGSASKERYMYIYHKDRIQILEEDTFDLSFNEKMTRVPFSIKFKVHDKRGFFESSSDKVFGLIGFHIKPKAAESELDHVPFIYNFYKSKWNDAALVLLGDFNADNPYVGGTHGTKPLILKDSLDNPLVSLIHKGIDTTSNPNRVSSLDRIFVGHDHLNLVAAAGPFYYVAEDPPFPRYSSYLAKKNVLWHQQASSSRYKHEFITKKLSDHFPVELLLNVD
jgi:hypothetical protein